MSGKSDVLEYLMERANNHHMWVHVRDIAGRADVCTNILLHEVLTRCDSKNDRPQFCADVCMGLSDAV
jgi:hypothetical protein